MITDSFQTLNMHPGAQVGGTTRIQGGIILLEDPYPDDSLRPENVIRVNVPKTTFWPLVWNMKTWDVQFNVTANITGAATENFTGSITGKMLQLAMTYNYQGDDGLGGWSGLELVEFYLRSTNATPKERVEGPYDHLDHPASNEAGAETTTHTSPTSVFVPAASVLYQQIPGPTISLPISRTVNDADAAASGNFTVDMEWTSSGNPGGSAAQIIGLNSAWLKDDDTVDMFFGIKAAFGNDYTLLDQNGAGRIELITQPVVEDIPAGIYDHGSVSINILGQTVTAYLRENPDDGSGYYPFDGVAGPLTVNSFSFSYDVTISESWTY